jgi:flavin reductase (DIM6/NTAB) family NADH-FMN oxidoreductase RutF
MAKPARAKTATPAKRENPVNRSPLRPFPLDRAFTFVESGPVLLIATAHGRQRNVMTVSCHASMGFEPTIGIMLGPWNHSYQALLETGECVAAIPGADLMEAAVDIGNCSGGEVDKFKRFGLTARKGMKVKAPLIAESGYLHDSTDPLYIAIFEPPRYSE